MLIGEIGGSEEERAAEFIARDDDEAGRRLHRRASPRRPAGRWAMPGRSSPGTPATAQAKIAALEACGARVARDPSEAGELMVEVVRGLG